MPHLSKTFNCITFLILFSISNTFGQNQSKRWYFGQNSGLNFNTPSPTILTNGVLNTQEGSASVSDSNGNLLFYTDGISIYNQTHAIMANGNGLMGNTSTTQGALIVKQPGNTNIYFVFTLDAMAGPNGLRYSVVDINLSAGNGSVTSKNNLLHTSSTEKMCSVRHCNGIDIWVVTHDWNSNQFRSYLITSSGISAPVFSNVGVVHGGLVFNAPGQMKASPNGRKLALCINSLNTFELFDFNSTTGQLSNALNLGSLFNLSYGVEFSPDGTKLYGGRNGISTAIFQWDLCAGSNTAITSSSLIVATPTVQIYSFQLSTDGKIYISRYGTSSLGAIMSPNNTGPSCLYIDNAQSVFPNTLLSGLPNILSSYLKQQPAHFTYTVSAPNCLLANFSVPTSSLTGCAAANYSVNSYLWDFGDLASGPNNFSSLPSPLHLYPSTGTYTAQLIINYLCGSDTLKLPVSVVNPTFSVSYTNPKCNGGLGSASITSVGGGQSPFSFTWQPSSQTSTIVNNLSAGIYSVSVTNAKGCQNTQTISLTEPSLITSTVNTVNPICFGQATGSSTVLCAGGTAPYTYSYSSGQTFSSAANLPAGSYSVTITDANNCILTNTFLIVNPAKIASSISVTNPKCFGENSGSATITPLSSGVINYSWSNGVTTPVVVNLSAGTYSCILSNSLGCSITQTVLVTNPSINSSSLSVNLFSVCPGQVIKAFGNTMLSYNWSINNSFISSNSNIITIQPTVSGSNTISLFGTDINGCRTLTSSLEVFVLPKPVADFNFSPAKPLEDELITLTDASFGGPINKWSWYFTSQTGSATSVLQNPQMAYSNAGQYLSTLVVCNAYGCCDTVSKIISVGEDYAIYVPNSFTPNGDGINDTFQPKGLGIKKYQLQIFDRWGNHLFSTSDFYQGWDGTVNSKNSEIIKDDVYVWKISLTNVFGKSFELTGHVTLLK